MESSYLGVLPPEIRAHIAQRFIRTPDLWGAANTPYFAPFVRSIAAKGEVVLLPAESILPGSQLVEAKNIAFDCRKGGCIPETLKEATVLLANTRDIPRHIREGRILHAAIERPRHGLCSWSLYHGARIYSVRKAEVERRGGMLLLARNKPKEESKDYIRLFGCQSYCLGAQENAYLLNPLARGYLACAELGLVNPTLPPGPDNPPLGDVLSFFHTGVAPAIARNLIALDAFYCRLHGKSLPPELVRYFATLLVWMRPARNAVARKQPRLPRSMASFLRGVDYLAFGGEGEEELARKYLQTIIPSLHIMPVQAMDILSVNGIHRLERFLFMPAEGASLPEILALSPPTLDYELVANDVEIIRVAIGRTFMAITSNASIYTSKGEKIAT